MKLRKVPPEQIVIPEVRVRAKFDPELYEQFLSSVKEVGVVAPIICCLVDCHELWPEEPERKKNNNYIQPDGKVFVLVDGEHRLVEQKNDGAEKVDIVVMEGTMVDVLTKNLFLDHMRGKTPVSEMVKVIEILWKEYSLDSEKIAEKTGLTRDYVEKLERISELTPYCRHALDEGRIGVGKAFELTRIKDPVVQETVMRQQDLHPEWTLGELKDYVDLVLTSQEQAELIPSAPPPPLFMVHCKYCGGKFEITQVTNPVICNDCSVTLSYAIAQARRELEAEAKAKTE